MDPTVQFTYDVIDLVGGPFNNHRLVRPSSFPSCPAHCMGDDGLVHVYDQEGSLLLYSKVYQQVHFPTQAEMPLEYGQSVSVV